MPNTMQKAKNTSNPQADCRLLTPNPDINPPDIEKPLAMGGGTVPYAKCTMKRSKSNRRRRLRATTRAAHAVQAPEDSVSPNEDPNMMAHITTEDVSTMALSTAWRQTQHWIEYGHTC